MKALIAFLLLALSGGLGSGSLYGAQVVPSGHVVATTPALAPWVSGGRGHRSVQQALATIADNITNPSSQPTPDAASSARLAS